MSKTECGNKNTPVRACPIDAIRSQLDLTPTQLTGALPTCLPPRSNLTDSTRPYDLHTGRKSRRHSAAKFHRARLSRQSLTQMLLEFFITHTHTHQWALDLAPTVYLPDSNATRALSAALLCSAWSQIDYLWQRQHLCIRHRAHAVILCCGQAYAKVPSASPFLLPLYISAHSGRDRQLINQVMRRGKAPMAIRHSRARRRRACRAGRSRSFNLLTRSRPPSYQDHRRRRRHECRQTVRCRLFNASLEQAN